jgi:hypothetical protein
MLEIILDFAIYKNQIENLENKKNIEVLEVKNSNDSKDIAFIKLKIFDLQEFLEEIKEF